MEITFNQVVKDFDTEEKSILNKLIKEKTEDEHGRNILMICASNGQPAIVEYIINQKDNFEEKKYDIISAILFTKEENPQEAESLINKYENMFLEMIGFDRDHPYYIDICNAKTKKEEMDKKLSIKNRY